MAGTQKFKTCLWFNGNAEEAMALYTSLFKNSKVGDINRGPDGRMIAGSFFLEGEEFMAINGGPEFTPNESLSIFVDCADQAEVDHLWKSLSADGGEESMCGWLKDKYGFSWQIVPRALMELLSDPDPGRAQRATEAMLQMRKIDVATLQAAADAAQGKS
jgi:predicted 3-demethylubiquinone-9 3-methyltransferase (glyoxalase superfamily)